MSAPRKYDQEFRERVVRMYRDSLAGAGDSKLGVRRHVGAPLDVNQATLRNWVEDAERANEILKTSAAIFRPGGARPPAQVIVAYIDAYRDRFGDEPICTVLSEHGCVIAPSTYYVRRHAPHRLLNLQVRGLRDLCPAG